MVNVHARYLDVLEAEGWLDRGLEFLPTDKQIAERQASGHGLQAPEFAVLIAYTKNANVAEIVSARPARRPGCSSADLVGVLPAGAARPLRRRHPPRTRCAGRSSPPGSSTRWSTCRASRSTTG